MGNNVEDQFHVRMTLAVLLIDDFTNRVITDRQSWVQIDGEGTPLRKQGGYHVFLNLKSKRPVVKVKSFQYQPQEVPVELSQLNPLQPLVTIRMQPSSRYRFLQGTTLIEGCAEAGSTVRVECSDIMGYYHITRDYKKESPEISLFNSGTSDFVGRWFCARMKRVKDDFKLMGHGVDESNLYQLSEPLTHDYTKGEARVYPILYLRADEDGKFFGAIPFFEKEHPACAIRSIDGVFERKLELEYGKLNHIT